MSGYFIAWKPREAENGFQKGDRGGFSPHGKVDFSVAENIGKIIGNNT